MRVFHIPQKPRCPLRIQMSDDEVAAAIQFRDSDDVPFYWLAIEPATAKRLIEEFRMVVVYRLPDAPQDQVIP